MILDASGKKISVRKSMSLAKKNLQAKAVVFISPDLKNWSPVHFSSVPERIRDDKRVMGALMKGEIISLNDDSGPYYIAEPIH